MGRQIEIPSIYMEKEKTGHIGLTCERGFCVVQEMALWEYTGEGIRIMLQPWKTHIYGQKYMSYLL